MATTNSPSPVPIHAHISSIEVIGNLGGRSSNRRPSHFVKVYVDDTKVMQSEQKPRVPAPRWEWNKDQKFLVVPPSTLRIGIYQKSYLIFKHLVGEHVGKLTDLLENDATLDLHDQAGTITSAQIKISASLVSESETGENFINFMEAVDANVSRLDRSTLPGISSLGTAVKLTKNIIDMVANAHPILKASWTILSAVYEATQQVGILDDTIRDLAENLRELLGVVKEIPNLRVIPDTTHVTEEVGRTSLKVASLIGEYTKISLINRTVKTKLSDEMRTRIDQCQKSLRVLKEKFDTRVMMAIKEEMDKNNIQIRRTLETIKDDQRAKEIYQWLGAPDSSPNYNDAQKKHQKYTCSWFLDGARFREFQEKAGFAWIKGTAGSGKTILCSSIISRIVELCKEDNSAYYAYFFFDGRDSQKELQLHDKLIRSLTHQLSLQCGGIPVPLMELYGHGGQQPSTSSLQNTLHRIIDGLDSVYIIIDSLDECVDRKEMLRWISDITTREMDNLHMSVTSRPERDISDILQQHDPCCVDLTDENNVDIAIYLDEQLEEEKKWDAETREIVKSKLKAGAEGMFRWVALQLIELKKCSNQQTVMEQLKRLPKGLTETYDQILFKIDEGNRADSKTFLQWLCFSIRPITLTELSEAIMVDFNGESEPRYTPSRRYWDQQDILEKCSGLITKSEETVKLAHFSIKEYLMSDYLRTRATVASFHITEELSHSVIAQTCLAYILQFDTYPPSSGIDSSPFADYATEYWFTHAQYGGIDKPDQSFTLILAEKLFTPHGAAFANWIWMWDSEENNWGEMKYTRRMDFPTPLYYASLVGLRRVAEHLLEDEDLSICEELYGNAMQEISAKGPEGIVKQQLWKVTDVNAQGGLYGNALQAASAEGHEAIAKLLVDKGADVNAYGGHYDNALQAASAGGYEAIAKLLVEKGADINAQGGFYGNALQAASAEGHEAIAKLLVEKGADINAQGGFYGNALQAASAEGHEAITKHLVEKGAEVNAQGGHRGNALQAASARGYEAIAKLLVEKGADINAQGGLYGNALQAASAGGHEAITKHLVEKGAEVNAQGGEYGNALQAASAGGYEAIAKLLVEKGADINAQGGFYGNALQAASARGHEAITKLLVEKGAEVNAQGGEYGNALQAASAGGYEAIAKLLVEKGADINAQGGLYGNALQAASARGHEAITKLLMEKGTDINAQGGLYGNALYAASAGGYEAIAKLLVDKGADINVYGGHYDNALQAASARGHEAITKLLVEKGADINAQGGFYGNALQAASAEGHEAITKHLVEKGADINAQGGEYYNALQAASARGYEAIAKLLVEKGADINAQGGFYGNALQAASAEGHEAITKHLVEKGAEVNAQGGEYGNALQAASARGHEAITKLLVEKDADVNAQGGEYCNALQAASARGHEAITKLLVEKGADVNAQGGHPGNALQAASAGGHETIVNLLVEKGADVNAHGGYYDNALYAASAGGYEAIAKLLVDKGANVNAQGGLYGNALYAASAGGYEAIAKLLVDKGAEVNAQGGHYGNALQAVSARAHEAIANLLVEKGADVDAHGGHYGNALQAASAEGHEAIAKLLVEKGADVNAQAESTVMRSKQR